MRDSPSIVLSIGMIVKNEERCLERCLKALEPLRKAVSCELIIADTGSTDSTRDIAARHADILFDFEWCNDFSAARNAVMDKSRGKWFFSIDADEYLTPDVRELVDFLTNKKYDRYGAAMVVVRNYNTLEMRAGDYKDGYPMRLLRMSTGLRFQGSIHEAWELQKEHGEAILLPTVIMDHDGYAMQQDGDPYAKDKRNLPLLEKELAKNPDNLMRVVQCLESSHTVEQQRRYSEMAVELAASEKGEKWPLWRGVAFKDAVLMAYKNKFPELIRWVEQGREICPKDMQIIVDVPFFAAQYYVDNGDYKNAVREAEQYRKGLAYYEKNLRNAKAFSMFPLNCIGEASRQTMPLAEAFSCVKLKRYEQALKALQEVKAECIDNAEAVSYIVLSLSLMWQSCGEDSAKKLLLRHWKAFGNAEADKGLRDAFIASGIAAFGENKTGEYPAWELFAALGSGCALGIAGMIMASDNAHEIKKLLASIESFDELPTEPVAKAVGLGIELPEGFFAAGLETISRHAQGTALLLGDGLLSLLEDGPAGSATPDSLLWRFLLANEAAKNFESHDPQLLCRIFGSCSDKYLRAFYTENVLNERYIGLIPSGQRFAWYIAKAEKTLTAGDQVGYVRYLRSGLKAEPQMGAMINYMLERIKEQPKPPKAEIPPEMMQLAEKIRLMLSQYPPEHPMVQQIKQSDAYKMFAHIIEGEE